MKKIICSLVLIFSVMGLFLGCGENQKVVDIRKTHHEYTMKEFLFYNPGFSFQIDQDKITESTPADSIPSLVKNDAVIALIWDATGKERKIYVKNTDLYRFPDSEIHIYLECGR